MTVQIPINFAECIIAITHSLQSHVASVTFGLAATSAADFDTAACNAILGEWTATIGTRMDTSSVAGPVSLIVGQDGPPLSLVGTDTDPGSHTITSLPPNCAALVTKATNTGGRRGRGRMFIPWCLDSADVNEGGFIGATPLGLLVAQVNNFRDNLSGLTPSFDMVLLHSPGASELPAPSPVTSLGVSSLIATQRRRLGR